MVDGKESSPFDVNGGVPQGDPSSPTFFSLFINDLVEGIQKLNLDLAVEEMDHMIQCLLYADDCVLLAKNGADMEKLSISF